MKGNLTGFFRLHWIVNVFSAAHLSLYYGHALNRAVDPKSLHKWTAECAQVASKL